MQLVVISYNRTIYYQLYEHMKHKMQGKLLLLIKNSEYDQEIPQSQTADKHMAPRGRATQQSRDTKKTN